MQVAAAMRILVGWPNFACRIHTLDVWEGTSKTIEAGGRDEHCETCGKRIFRFLEQPRKSPVSLCGRNAVQLHGINAPVDLKELAARLRNVGDVRLNDFALRITISKYDLTVFGDGRAIIKGTSEIGVARAVYARLLNLGDGRCENNKGVQEEAGG
jgi:adenylyltransferase/sulfurtransferase